MGKALTGEPSYPMPDRVIPDLVRLFLKFLHENSCYVIASNAL